ncbi:MAG TPA: DNA mismatch repair endonuclease MutH [Polyangiaceae bacterium]
MRAVWYLATMSIRPPSTQGELRDRARWLSGRTIGDVAAALGVTPPEIGARGKGKIGSLIERALGAEAGSTPQPDFPRLGIELKTIPVDSAGSPRESTFVCTISLADADRAEWETSVARAKLSHVLFVPVVVDARLRSDDRKIGAPLFWRPSPEQEAVLRADFEEALGLVGTGQIEALTARTGRWLQVRPKARTGSVRTVSFGPEGEWIATVPRGFYLRASFTRALLQHAR